MFEKPEMGYHRVMNGIGTHSTATGLLDAARSTIDQVDIIDIGDLTDTVADTAGEVAEIATPVTATGGRLVIRTARAGGRLVRNHPRGTVGIVSLLAMIAGLAWFTQRRTADEATTELKVAA